MRELYSDYEMYSYNVQRDVCQLRRQVDLPCRKCRYLNKCKGNDKIVDKLNKDLKDYKPRYFYK